MGADHQRITLALVDDHRMFVQSLTKLLAQEPSISVVALAGSAAGAIEAVRRHEPDVVLMDNALPDGRGTDVAAQIHREHPATKVVMLTASEDHDVLLAAIDAGCVGYITKLSAVDEVVAAIHAAQAGEVVMPPAMLADLMHRVGHQPARPGPGLSDREMEVLRLVAEGLPNAEIAARLYLSTNTVRNHVKNILSKLGVHSKLEAVATAVRQGLIRYP